MNGMPAVARMLMAMGLFLFVTGLLVYILSKSGISFGNFGKLPGDISWQGKNVKVFAPITSMIVVSIVLSIIVNLISSRFGGK